jgi:anti-sigma B factor antagonist
MGRAAAGACQDAACVPAGNARQAYPEGRQMPEIPALVSLPGLKLETLLVGDTTVVKCTGRLTVEVSGPFRRQMKDLIPQARRILLDLSKLTYMDSSGLGAVVGLYVSAKASGCELRLANFNERVRELLGITQVLSALEACGQYLIKIP